MKPKAPLASKDPIKIIECGTYTAAESSARTAIQAGLIPQIYHRKDGYWIVEVYD